MSKDRIAPNVYCGIETVQVDLDTTSPCACLCWQAIVVCVHVFVCLCVCVCVCVCFDYADGCSDRCRPSSLSVRRCAVLAQCADWFKFGAPHGVNVRPHNARPRERERERERERSAMPGKSSERRRRLGGMSRVEQGEQMGGDPSEKDRQESWNCTGCVSKNLTLYKNANSTKLILEKWSSLLIVVSWLKQS